MSGDREDDPGPARDDRKVGAGRAVFTGVGQLCETAVRMTGVDGAAVALLTARTQVRDLVYATDPLAQRLDELQFTLGEGPCLDAYTRGAVCAVPDLQASDPGARWPGFISEATQVGAAAVFAFPITHDERSLGVLELYRITPGTLTKSAYKSAVSCAAAAGDTVAANWSRYTSELHGSLSPEDALAQELADPATDTGFSRSQVFMASGMLSVQMGISPDEALDRLRAHALGTGRPVTDVADDIIGRRLTDSDVGDGQGR